MKLVGSLHALVGACGWKQDSDKGEKMSEVIRAYSILHVKHADGAQRILTGTATTPETDRVGDQVDPLGCVFKNPLPLLWQHQPDQPVGHAEFGRATASGIPFTAQIAKVDEPGVLKDRLDEAWQSVQARLVSSVSIGFRVLDNAVESIKGGGLKFLRTEIMELSLVTIPANSQCTIQTVKSADQAVLASMQMATMRKQSDDDSAIAKSTAPATVGFVARGLRNFAEAVGRNVKAAIEKRTDALEQRIAALEQTSFEYKGVYVEGLTYRRGQFVTCSGSLHHANTTTTSRPGSDNTWTLCCKRGADGKDAR